MLWSSKIPLKISFFTWRSVQKFLEIDSALQARGIPLDSKCACCNENMEPERHLFIEGPAAHRVWSHFQDSFGIPRTYYSCISSLLMSLFLPNPNVMVDSMCHSSLHFMGAETKPAFNPVESIQCK